MPAELKITNKLDGHPVTSIGEEVFYVCIQLTSVVIPDSVTTIDDDAFKYCDLLTIEASTNEQFKVNFDANGGEFSNNKDIIILENWKNKSDYFKKIDSVEESIREGYKFLGYYTEKVE